MSVTCSHPCKYGSIRFLVLILEVIAVGLCDLISAKTVGGYTQPPAQMILNRFQPDRSNEH